jgi:hypothetical protein
MVGRHLSSKVLGPDGPPGSDALRVRRHTRKEIGADCGDTGEVLMVASGADLPAASR